MIYFKILRKERLIGIGFANTLPDDCTLYTYIKINKTEFNTLDKKFFNGK